MKRAAIKTVGLAGYLVASLLAIQIAAADEIDWHKLTSETGRFTAQFPVETPEEQPETNKWRGTVNHSFAVELSSAAGHSSKYQVFHIDCDPEDLAQNPPRRFLDAFAHAELQGHKVKTKKYIQFKGHPGVEASWEETRRVVDFMGAGLDATFVKSFHVYLVKNRIYALIVEDDSQNAEMTKKFLDSFDLLEGGSGSEEPTGKETNAAVGKLDFQNVESLSPAGGNFSIKMPGHSNEETEKKTKSTRHLWSVDNGVDLGYSVSYTDFEDLEWMVNDPRRAMKGYRSGAHKDHKIVADTEITLGKSAIPGYDYLCETGQEGFYMRERMYAVKTRLYFVAVVGSKEAVYSRDAERFFNSFTITQ